MEQINGVTPNVYIHNHCWGWSRLAGLGPVPWRQVSSLYNSAIPQSELHFTVPYEVDFSTGNDKLKVSNGLSSPCLGKKKIEDFSERLLNESLKLGAQDTRENGNADVDVYITLMLACTFSSANIVSKSAEWMLNLLETICCPGINSVPYTSPDGANGQIGFPCTHLQPNSESPLAKQFHCNLHNGLDASGETLIHNGRPRFTDPNLQQTSGEYPFDSKSSNPIITPLFEKMLSASDAGRIGRLVLPKKCAETSLEFGVVHLSFPSIVIYMTTLSSLTKLESRDRLISHQYLSQKGYLKVQDSKGKEWVFQFRFWPDNNSRMYVLEGVTPCLQDMQLQAGDIVTFSRLEPGEMLVMGFRKAAPTSTSELDSEAKNSNGVSMHGDADLADPTSFSKFDKSGHIAKEPSGTKPAVSRKKKNSSLGSKSKHRRVDNEDLIELKITWEEAHGLLRPPANHVPSVVVIEGVEFEEYEDAPILGRPTIFASDNWGSLPILHDVEIFCCNNGFLGANPDVFLLSGIRFSGLNVKIVLSGRLPSTALLPYRWTCSSNSWDPERSLCSAAQELTAEQLEDLLPHCYPEGKAFPASSQATTKHPQHRPGCSCIVCIQPPSGKGPKHKQTCTCNVCQTIKRRFRTHTLRREKKQTQKEAETTCKKQKQPSLPDKELDADPLPYTNAGNTGPSPKKREGELSSGSDSSNTMRLLQDTTERYDRQQSMLNFSGNTNPELTQILPGNGLEEGKTSNSISLGASHRDIEGDHSAVLSIKTSTPTSATD
ncbi:HSI2-like 1 isoform 2 [Hibiscus syriacus]|uniref:HSI2-like 1 isoform 2 n=1 Tax=Hibiscus syriacus TaxID=106335 RepID=A0A6A3BDT4_HIBSY|nr:HSI2-like 1 isoform 2 [Hibiscus syriacus]